MIELIALASPFVAGYIYLRIIRPRIIQTNNDRVRQDVPIQTPYYFLVTAEQGTLEHEIAEEHTLLEKVVTDDTTGIDTFYATPEDMIEHMERLDYNRQRITDARKKRMGYTKKRKAR